MKIAIIGTGISGLASAYLLHNDNEITVYEKNDYIGGHSRTVTANTKAGPIPVDTGFIVFNYQNYPHLTGLFEHLNVHVEKSDMSFAASIDNGWFEYGTKDLPSIFSQKTNLLRPAFWRMIRDIMKFNKHALPYMEEDNTATLGECLEQLGMGEWFKRYYILAMGGAIWSCPLEQMLEFPAATFVRFFHNHGLLTMNDQPQWYTVTGGSKEYVKRLTQPFNERIKTNCGVNRVVRKDGKVNIQDSNHHWEEYDQVIFSCHADQALAMIDNPTKQEKNILGSFGYQENQVILHGDTSFMPKRKGAWASWVYMLEGRKDNRPAISLSYWMNRLQNLNPDTPLIVTLNPGKQPKKELVYDTYTFEHPIFDAPAITAQSKMDTLQGHENTWYCGAYQRYGFHEDGIWSAVRVAKKLKATIPWN